MMSNPKCERAGCSLDAEYVITGREFGLFDLGPVGTLLCEKDAEYARRICFPVERIEK
jgi:hypothetical protein